MKDKKIVLLFAAAYAALFIIFFPKFMFILDDSGYLRTAYLFREGKLYHEDPLKAYSPGAFAFNGKHYVPVNFPGYSFFLIPFTLLGWKLVFISGLLLHLAGTLVFYKILKRLGQKTIYALLYLLFPPFIYYSTVLINNYLAAVLIMAAFYFYLGEGKHEGALSGALLGLAAFTRYPELIMFITLAAIAFFRDRKKCLKICLGFLPFALLILLYNHVQFGSALSSGYSYATSVVRMDSEPFSAIRFITLQFPLQLAVYAAKLLILYPLMLLALFLYKGKGRAELIISSMAVLILYSASAAFLADPTLNTISISNTIFGTRYLLPIMPLLLASYAPFIEAVLKRIDSRKAVTIAAVLLLALGVPVLQAQAALTERNLRISEAIYQNTAEGSVIIGNDINYLFLLEEIGERGYIDIKTPDAKANNSYIVYSMSFMNRDKGAEEMKRALSAYNATQIYSRSFQAGIWATKPSIEIFIYRVENRGY